MSRSTTALIQRLLDVMRRSDPTWCELHGKRPTDDEEWDAAMSEAEDWIEDNTP